MEVAFFLEDFSSLVAVKLLLPHQHEQEVDFFLLDLVVEVHWFVLLLLYLLIFC